MRRAAPGRGRGRPNAEAEWLTSGPGGACLGSAAGFWPAHDWESWPFLYLRGWAGSSLRVPFTRFRGLRAGPGGVDHS